MDGSSDAMRRAGFGLLAGACLALGWAALSVLLGSGPAHASEPSNPNAAGQGTVLTSLVRTVDAAIPPVGTAVTNTVTEPARTVASAAVNAVAAPTTPAPPAPGGHPAPILEDAPAPAVTAPVVGAVAPVVGATLAPALDEATGHVDALAATAIDVVTRDVARPVTASLGSEPVTSIASPVVDRLHHGVAVGALRPPLTAPVTHSGDPALLVAAAQPRGPAPWAVRAVARGESVFPPLDRGPSDSDTSAARPPGAPPSAPPAPPSPGPWWGLASPAVTGASGSGAASAPLASAAEHPLTGTLPPSGRAAGAPEDDDLPSSPVYPADVAPD
ncbi:hypothetical protein [Microbacterium capsulatum]|uniref:Meckel syndrome type 1 protein n=1 Tax=Microbacterium capsulatum TaxID=3041921 RepID=A0ABU0XI86_9MICO|nr:hypothetical protein [Microbacterium sp. ASV81]MDQ4214838.1 hypothetical protein [Microbacterium sp. ASV81]